MVSVLERPATEYGYYFISVPLGFMIGNYVTRHFGQRFGIHRMIDYGSRISIAGIVLAIGIHSAGFTHPAGLFFPIALAIFGNGITLPSANAGIVSVRPHLAGSASGLVGAIMIGGGAHSMIHPLGVMGFSRLTALSTRNDSPKTASRPFTASRDGFVLGEGAAIVILESLESARKRAKAAHRRSPPVAVIITRHHVGKGIADLRVGKITHHSGWRETA